MLCPDCGEPMKFVENRETGATSLFGEIRYSRPYYHGCSCQRGLAPGDVECDLQDKMTRAAQQVVTLHGCLESFDEAAEESLSISAGVNLASSTVRRVTEKTGADLKERRAAGETFGEDRVWDWERDAAGRTCAYASLDATGVSQQAEDGGEAGGRMVWVGEVFNPTSPQRRRGKRARVWDKRFVSGLMSLPEMSRQLRREALSVGLDQADVLIGLTDGGAGLEDCLLDVFAGLGGQMEFILDFFHASEHVHEFARALHDDKDERSQEQAGVWCHTLKHEGGEALLAELESLDLAENSEAVRECHRQLCNYVRNNRHRMDYPRYVANGWQIGSGSIESACKTVINQRLNGSGMRWSEHGTDELAHVRALRKSEPTAWHDYWARPPTRSAV